MKRLSDEQRLYNIRVVEKRERKRKRRTRRRKSGREKTQNLLLFAPVRFNLFQSKFRGKLLRFLFELRASAKKGGTVTINFKDTVSMVSSGALLFKAELDRLILLFGQKTRFRCIPPKSNRIKQVLDQIGVFSTLKCKCEIHLTREDVIHWKTARGSKVEGEKYDEILGSYVGALAGPVTSGLYSGITEAMANSVDHAYIKVRKDGLNMQAHRSDWWMFSQKKDGNLFVVFCDLGVGIPATIATTRPKLWGRIKRFVNLSNDSEIIHFATGSGRSRTEKDYRGRGLPQLLKEIRKIPGGKLSIMSNKGLLGITEDEETRKEFSNSILGTLLAWEVPLPENGGSYE